MKYKYLFFFIVFTLSPIQFLTANAEELNAGFVDGLWFSSSEMYAETPVRIYAAMRNNTGSDITATVTFLSDNNVLVRKEISALDGRIIETWADWTPTYGEHTVAVTLTNIKLYEIGGATSSAEVVSSVARSTIFVDHKPSIEVHEDVPVKEDVRPDTQDDVHSEEDSEKPQQGLEQYIDNERVKQILTNVTEIINGTKRSLDSYRNEREVDEEMATTTRSPAELLVRNPLINNSTTTNFSKGLGSFGEIARTQATTTDEGFVKATWGIVQRIASALYSGLLLVLSTVLGHPTLIQIGLLLFILYILFRFAKKLGGRRIKGY